MYAGSLRLVVIASNTQLLLLLWLRGLRLELERIEHYSLALRIDMHFLAHLAELDLVFFSDSCRLWILFL